MALLAISNYFSKPILSLFIILSTQTKLTPERFEDITLSKQVILNLSNKIISNTLNETECGENLSNLRWFFRFLPEEVKDGIKSELVNNILGQFPRLRFEVVTRLVNQMFDLNVDPQFVCRELDRILFPEARRRDECTKKCVAKIDTSPLRLARLIRQCGFELDCYLRELALEMQNLQNCISECVNGPDSKNKLVLDKKDAEKIILELFLLNVKQN